MNNLITKLKHGLIVSCQSEEDDPFNHPDMMVKFSRAAFMGGAVGIRANGIDNISAIRKEIDLPIIGVVQGQFENGWVCITPDFKDIENIIEAGADIVALDVTSRYRPNGMDGIEFFDETRDRFDIPLLADIATFEEGIRAAELGADLIATTLAGNTDYTMKQSTDGPNYDLIEKLSRAVKIPVIAEGYIWTPEQAKEILQRGAFAVVVGSAITRPRVMTKRFVDTMASKIH
ncbi:MAG: N-acetylmannosamine-6-phosphate 2-epimerase [Bacteroidota bacterium]|nr:N-acetylmannosamine-6-phosphate 2-epimerase [Bacteroidota bacterium]